MNWFHRIVLGLSDVDKKLDRVLKNQQEEKQQNMIDTKMLDAQDAQILQTVAALGPLIQTAITDIGQVTASDAAGQEILDKHVASFQTVADGLATLRNSLVAAESPTPAPPAPTPAPPATS